MTMSASSIGTPSCSSWSTRRNSVLDGSCGVLDHDVHRADEAVAGAERPRETSRLSGSCSPNVAALLADTRDRRRTRMMTGARRPTREPEERSGARARRRATTTTPATIVQPGDRHGRPLQAAELDVALERLPPAMPGDPLLRALREHRATSARRDAGFVLRRHRDVVRHPSLERALARSRATERSAKARSASTATTTKTMSHGERMTLSIQSRWNEPRSAKSIVGVVYVAVGRRDSRGRRPRRSPSLGRKQRTVGDDVLARELGCRSRRRSARAAAESSLAMYVPPVAPATFCRVSAL